MGFETFFQTPERVVRRRKANEMTFTKGNAPVYTNYSEAESVLNDVRLAKVILRYFVSWVYIVLFQHYLDRNLEAMLRARQEDDVYALFDDVSRCTPTREKVRIKRMVDRQIGSLRGEIEVKWERTTLKIYMYY